MYPVDIQKILKNKGYRITSERQEVLKILNNKPLTAQEINNLLKEKKVNVDLASVYRSLDLFVKLGIVRALELGEGKKRYEVADENNHHHHLVCNNCGDIEDIIVNEKNLIEDMKIKSKFKIDHHHLEFFGLCLSCQ